MNRRSALKAIAAAIMTPLVRLRAEVDREALMLPFCATWDYSRYDLLSPFKQGSLVYATDTYRMIRAELSGPEITGERRIPPAEKAWTEHWRPIEWIEVSKPDISELHKRTDGVAGTCPLCFDRMISCGPYYLSATEMQELWDRGIRYDVDDNTKGDETCSQCQGTQYYGPSIMRIANQQVSFALMAPVFDLPGTVLVSANKFVNGPVLFTADGFEGMVMPMVLA